VIDTLPEVGKSSPLVVEQDVVRLDIAMDEPPPVQVRETRGNRTDDVDDLPRVDPSAGGQAIGQRAPIAQLHDVERLAARRGIARLDVEHLDDARMGRRGERQGLALEALGEGRIRGQVRQEHLDRDVALKAQVEGLVDGGHPADADRRIDPVPAGEDVTDDGHVRQPTRRHDVGGRPPPIGVID